jgi:hypothetical protein
MKKEKHQVDYGSWNYLEPNKAVFLGQLLCTDCGKNYQHLQNPKFKFLNETYSSVFLTFKSNPYKLTFDIEFFPTQEEKKEIASHQFRRFSLKNATSQDLQRDYVLVTGENWSVFTKSIGAKVTIQRQWITFVDTKVVLIRKNAKNVIFVVSNN